MRVRRIQPLFTPGESTRITPVTTEDIPALCALLDLLFTQEADFQPDRAAQARGLAAIIGDPAIGHILVGRQEDQTGGRIPARVR